MSSGQSRPAAESAREGLEHLRGAARELIAASRCFLDAAETVVEQGSVADVAGLLDGLGSLLSLLDPAARRTAGHHRGASAGRARATAGEAAASEGAGAASNDAQDPQRRVSRVRRVSVG